MLLISEKLELDLKAKLFRGFGDPSRSLQSGWKGPKIRPFSKP